MAKIAIIDYGSGNIHSVFKAVENCGGNPVIFSHPFDFSDFNGVILPGVGHFGYMVKSLKEKNLWNLLEDILNSQSIPFLGICLGMQVLGLGSEEEKGAGGFGIINEFVRRFPEDYNLKIPQMGWNNVYKIIGESMAEKIFSDIDDGEYFYFCHSYYLPIIDGWTSSKTIYGIEYSSSVCNGNIMGVQFHPEKSQKAGLKIIRNFVELCLK